MRLTSIRLQLVILVLFSFSDFSSAAMDENTVIESECHLQATSQDLLIETIVEKGLEEPELIGYYMGILANSTTKEDSEYQIFMILQAADGSNIGVFDNTAKFELAAQVRHFAQEGYGYVALKGGCIRPVTKKVETIGKIKTAARLIYKIDHIDNIFITNKAPIVFKFGGITFFF